MNAFRADICKAWVKNRTTWYYYDAANNLTTTVYSATNKVHYTYAPNSLMTGMVDTVGTTHKTYDNMNRLISSIDHHGLYSGYQYDKAGNVTNLIYQSSTLANPAEHTKSVAYMYDAVGRNIALRDWNDQLIEFRFDPDGNLVSTIYPNGIVSTNWYDFAGRSLGYRYIRGSSNLVCRTFTRNAAGQKITEQIWNGLVPKPMVPTVQQRQYDAADRLTQLSRKTVPTDSTWSNALCRYDNHGNITSDCFGAAYTYNREHRLIKYRSPICGNDFVYDGSGVKTRRDNKYILYDRSSPIPGCLGMYNGLYYNSGRFIWGPNGIMAQYQNNLFCTFLVDEAGSIIAFADASGNIGFESAWSPYGRYMNYSYGPGSFSGSWFYYLGAHGIQNICGDLYCMNARHYHAGLKRFLTPDPIGLDGGFNLYLYANNNPVLYVDPSGYISYLMVTGFDETDIFTDAAIQRSVEIMTSDGFDFYRDEVVHVPAFSVGQISRALQNNEDIAELSYFGHGGPGVLYISGSQGEPFNLSVNGGPAGVASESTSISTMPTENVLPGAKINLYSCSSAVSKGGTPSIAQGFADHFNTTVKGSGAGVGFDSKGPYIQPWRAAVGKAKNILPGHSGGGAWKDVKPTQAPKIQK